MHAQMLRDLVASEWLSIVLPTSCPVVAAAKHAGKQYAEAAAIVESRGSLGPPHLHIGRAAFKSIVDSQECQQVQPSEMYTTVKLFYTRFMSVGKITELGLQLKHFRVKRCYNEEFSRIQFSLADAITVVLDDQSKA